MKITRIDSRKDDISEAMKILRERLSPRGDVVSQTGRERTLAIFGEPLSPQETVERICRDIDQKGASALLDYCKRIDNADLSPETLRVSTEELAEAHAKADPDFLAAVRSVRETSGYFRKRSCTKTSKSSFRTGIFGSVIDRCTGSGFVFPAERQRIRLPS